MKKFEEPKVDVCSLVLEDILNASGLPELDDMVGPIPGVNETPIG